jgi:hypothetical protein
MSITQITRKRQSLAKIHLNASERGVVGRASKGRRIKSYYTEPDAQKYKHIRQPSYREGEQKGRNSQLTKRGGVVPIDRSISRQDGV